jgi:hypothetical protein
MSTTHLVIFESLSLSCVAWHCVVLDEPVWDPARTWHSSKSPGVWCLSTLIQPVQSRIEFSLCASPPPFNFTFSIHFLFFALMPLVLARCLTNFSTFHCLSQFGIPFTYSHHTSTMYHCWPHLLLELPHLFLFQSDFVLWWSHLSALLRNHRGRMD